MKTNVTNEPLNDHTVEKQEDAYTALSGQVGNDF